MSTQSRPTSRPITARRQRILAERQAISDKIYEWTDVFAGPAPTQAIPGSSGCRFRTGICYGRGDDFDLIGRWTGLCIIPAHKDSGFACTKTHLLTARLEDWQLDLLRGLWVDYDRLGKKWGKASVPDHLYARTEPTRSAGPPPAASTSQRRADVLDNRPSSSRTISNTKTSQKRKRSPSPVLRVPKPQHIIDLTSPPAKKRRLPLPIIDVDVIDISSDSE
ncbi:hypothetical protein B0H11DRAFT_2215242 [Mycena galericulata]|nr:hypothetical protein B0H11DRAFT_2215242 [Mycena galericulata]